MSVTDFSALRQRMESVRIDPLAKPAIVRAVLECENESATGFIAHVLRDLADALSEIDRLQRIVKRLQASEHRLMASINSARRHDQHVPILDHDPEDR